MWQKLFQTKHFRVQLVDDVAGVSLCGALKSELSLPPRALARRVEADRPASLSLRRHRRRRCWIHRRTRVGKQLQGSVSLLLPPTRQDRDELSSLFAFPSAAIMRIGLLEIKQFCFEFFPGVKVSSSSLFLSPSSTKSSEARS